MAERQSTKTRSQNNSGDVFSPLLQFLALMGRKRLGTASSGEQIDLPEGIEPEKLAQIIRTHRMTPALPVLFSNPPSDPSYKAEFEPVLHDLLKRHNLTILGLTGNLAVLSKTFSRGGVEMLSLKGPALAWQMFGDTSARRSVDLDILVRPSQVDKAVSLLESKGFELVYPKAKLTPKRRKAVINILKDFGFRGPNGTYVELHWGLMNKRALLSLSLDKLFSDKTYVELGPSDVATPSLEHTFLYLCVHGAKHMWESLGWIYDIAHFIQFGLIDWIQFHELCKRYGTERMAAQAMFLAARFFHVQVPAPFRSLLRSDPVIREMVYDVLPVLENPKGKRWFHTPYFKKYSAKLKPGLLYKFRLFFSNWTHPEDWEQVDLPDNMFRLYYVLRPFLWLKRMFG